MSEDNIDRSDKLVNDTARALPNAGRRDLLMAAGLASVGGIAGALAAAPTTAMAQSSPSAPSAPSASRAGAGASLGARLRGVQHFGLTVQNMDRAFEFYTQVLGGTEILRDGNFSGEKIQNTLLLTEEIRAPWHDQCEGEPHRNRADRSGAPRAARRYQYESHHGRAVRRLVADLLQGPRGRTARVRAGARSRQADVRQRVRDAPPRGGRSDLIATRLRVARVVGVRDLDDAGRFLRRRLG